MEKKYGTGISTIPLCGTASESPGSVSPDDSEVDREDVIRVLADYACLGFEQAAFFVDKIAAGEAFAVGDDTVSWQEIPARKASDASRN